MAGHQIQKSKISHPFQPLLKKTKKKTNQPTNLDTEQVEADAGEIRNAGEGQLLHQVDDVQKQGLLTIKHTEALHGKRKER